jgi:hypothetical protein
VLLVNGPIAVGEHDLTDVTASILDFYGLPPEAGMVGASFLRAGQHARHSPSPSPVGPGR